MTLDKQQIIDMQKISYSDEKDKHQINVIASKDTNNNVMMRQCRTAMSS